MKIKINKSLILIIIGILLFGMGMFLYTSKSSNNLITAETKVLSRDDAISVMTELINNTIKVYENPSSVFEIVKSDLDSDDNLDKKEDTFYINIDNYQKVVSSLFSENGIKQFENMTFDKKKFVTKTDNSVLLLKNIPTNSQYIKSKIIIDKVSVTEKKISCEVTFSSYSIDSSDVINYYVITKTIVAIKSDNNWLIEDFEYNNE